MSGQVGLYFRQDKKSLSEDSEESGSSGLTHLYSRCWSTFYKKGEGNSQGNILAILKKFIEVRTKING